MSTITPNQIIALRTAADRRGNEPLCRICSEALSGDQKAIAHCDKFRTRWLDRLAGRYTGEGDFADLLSGEPLRVGHPCLDPDANYPDDRDEILELSAAYEAALKLIGEKRPVR